MYVHSFLGNCGVLMMHVFLPTIFQETSRASTGTGIESRNLICLDMFGCNNYCSKTSLAIMLNSLSMLCRVAF